MSEHEELQRAIQETAIHRRRMARLLTVGSTELPYVWVGTSMVNLGDTVIRKGVVRVERPQLFLFNPATLFEGFTDESEAAAQQSLLALGRAASFPPGKYSNIDARLDLYEGPLEKAVEHYGRQLDHDEDFATGLVSGPADIWALSLMVYVGAMVMQNASDDVQDLLRSHFTNPNRFSRS